LELAEVGAAEQVGPNTCQHESLEDLGHGWQACSSLVNFHVWGISSCLSYNSKNIVDVCSADIPLHIGIRQTSDEGSPIVISQPDSVQVSLPSVIQTSLFFHRPTML